MGHVVFYHGLQSTMVSMADNSVPCKDERILFCSMERGLFSLGDKGSCTWLTA